MKKILLINLIICLILFAALEFVSYLYLRKGVQSFLDNFNKAAKEINGITLTIGYGPSGIYDQKKSPDLRNIKIGNSNKRPIIFFGCSYMNGATLEENQTLPYIISEKTGRSTVNRGISSGSINNTIYDLRDDNFYKLLELNNIKNPEYIVYMYISDHLKRILVPYMGYVVPSDRKKYEIVIRYKLKDGKLVENKPSKITLPLYSLFTTKAYYYLFLNKHMENSTEDIMIDLFKAAKGITDEKFNKPKFVIIMYKDSGRLLMSDNMIKKLQDSGFIIFDAEKLAGHELVSDEWRSFDKEHPNEKAFQDVAKGLIKELKL